MTTESALSRESKNGVNSRLYHSPRIPVVQGFCHEHRTYRACVRYLAILLPCFFVSASAHETNERPELLNGGSLHLEMTLEKAVNIWNVMSGPVSPRRFKPSEGWTEGRTQLGGSGYESGPVFPPHRKTMTGKCNKEHSDQGNECDGYCGLYLSLPMWLVAVWIALRRKS